MKPKKRCTDCCARNYFIEADFYHVLHDHYFHLAPVNFFACVSRRRTLRTVFIFFQLFPMAAKKKKKAAKKKPTRRAATKKKTATKKKKKR